MGAPTWFPAYRPLLPTAEADFAKDAEDVSLTQRPWVFTGTRAFLVGGNLLIVGLASLTLLSDQGAGDGRRHPPEEPNPCSGSQVWIFTQSRMDHMPPTEQQNPPGEAVFDGFRLTVDP